MGDVLSFAGGNIIHGGDPLISGIRYILAVFLYLEKEVENDVKQITKFEDEKETEAEEEEEEEKEEEEEGEDEKEEEKLVLFIKSFLSCYRADHQFILKSIKNKDSTLITGTVIDNSNLHSDKEKIVYDTATNKSDFSFDFNFIE